MNRFNPPHSFAHWTVFKELSVFPVCNYLISTFACGLRTSCTLQGIIPLRRAHIKISAKLKANTLPLVTPTQLTPQANTRKQMVFNQDCQICLKPGTMLIILKENHIVTVPGNQVTWKYRQNLQQTQKIHCDSKNSTICQVSITQKGIINLNPWN